jgi:hypothetical protein
MYAAAGNQPRTIHFHDVRRRSLDHGPEMGAAENVHFRQFCTLQTFELFSEDSGKELFRLKTSSCLERSCARTINMPMMTNSEKATMKECQNGHQSVHRWSTDAGGD